METETQTAQEVQRENYWNYLLSHMKPWELHALLTARLPLADSSAELYLHDNFVAGNIYLRDVLAFVEGRLQLA